MRQHSVTYQLYPIQELSGKAQERAHNDWLCNGYYYGWSDENRNTLDRFCESFGVKCSRWNYDSCNYSYSFHTTQEDCIDELKGGRLATYLINHHWSDLCNPKSYWKNGKRRASRIFVDACCPITGYYIDECILAPIRQFLQAPSEEMTFERLMNKCLNSFFNGCKEDMESTQSMEYFIEESQNNDWEYLENGKQFN